MIESSAYLGVRRVVPSSEAVGICMKRSHINGGRAW